MKRSQDQWVSSDRYLAPTLQIHLGVNLVLPKASSVAMRTRHQRRQETRHLVLEVSSRWSMAPHRLSQAQANLRERLQERIKEATLHWLHKKVKNVRIQMASKFQERGLFLQSMASEPKELRQMPHPSSMDCALQPAQMSELMFTNLNPLALKVTTNASKMPAKFGC